MTSKDSWVPDVSPDVLTEGAALQINGESSGSDNLIMVRDESLEFFNPAIAEVISSSGIKISTTVTFCIREQRRNTS